MCIRDRLDDVVSTYDGTTYRYSIESIGAEADAALKCHYVNVRILFEVINLKLEDYDFSSRNKKNLVCRYG